MEGPGSEDSEATGRDEVDGEAAGEGPVMTGEPHDRIARATRTAQGRRGGRSMEDPTARPIPEFSGGGRAPQLWGILCRRWAGSSMAEQLTLNQLVGSSSLPRLTSIPHR